MKSNTVTLSILASVVTATLMGMLLAYEKGRSIGKKMSLQIGRKLYYK